MMKRRIFLSVLLILLITLASCSAQPEAVESTAGMSTETESPAPPSEEPESGTEAPDPDTSVDSSAKEPTASEDGAQTESTVPGTCHVWGAWVTDKEPSCEIFGERSRTCEMCGETETESIRYLSHDYTEWELTIAPGCTDRGREERLCMRCGVQKSRSVRALGHAFGEWITLVEAECRTAGERMRVCSACSHTETEAPSPTGHAWRTDNVCSVCSERAVATEGLQFSQLSDGTYAVTSYTGEAPVVMIPPYYNGAAVTRITGGAFANTRVLSITVPENMRFIEDGAFDGCRPTEIVNDSALTLRGGSGRYGGIAKYALKIHNGESRIREEKGFLLFDGDGGAMLVGYAGRESTLVLPETVDGIAYGSIHSYAFDGCDSLREIVLHGQLRKIGDYAFRGCTALSTVVIPDAVTDVGAGAFSGCVGLVGVTLGASLERVGKDAFLGCYKLSEIINFSTLPIRAGDAAYGFVAANALCVHSGESLIAREGDLLILRGERASYVLSYLGNDTVLTLPAAIDGAEYQIRSYAFYRHSTLKGVILGAGVNAIGLLAFEGSDALYYEGDADAWSGVSVYGTLDATVFIYNSEPPSDGGNCWRYVDGVPVPW